MFNAQFFDGFYLEATFKTKIFRKALGHVEDYHFTQFVHRGSVRFTEMLGFYTIAIVSHYNPSVEKSLAPTRIELVPSP